MSPPQVSVAVPADRQSVVDTFVSAFAADPALRFFLPDDRTYPELAAALAGHLFDRRVAGGTVLIAGGGLSVAMWEAPAGTVGTGGVPADGTPPALDAAALDRWLAYDAAVHSRLPAEPHWYLGVLATHRAAAGRRLGRAVLNAGLRTAAAAGLPSVLETSSQVNVALYARSGFEVIAEFEVESLPVWMMRRPPQPPARS